MNPKYRIGSTFLSDWFALEGGGNWASVEGARHEWEAVARAIPAREGVRFKRLALAWRKDGGAEFFSPRNAAGTADYVLLTATEADHLAKQIVAFLAENPAPVESAME